MKYIVLLILIIFIYILYIQNYDSEKYDSPSLSNKKVFITFGAGNQNYYDAVNRLTSQAKNLNLFDTIIGYTDNDLKNDSDFWNKHSDFISKNNRGFGYWLWKPYLIMKILETMNDGDILVYADCGCEIYNKYKNDMINVFANVNNDLIIGSRNSNESQYNKMDLLIYLNMNEEKYIYSEQHQASAICFLKCKKTYNLVREWYDIGCNYNLIDDSPSKIPNLTKFIEHRHDQSIFSLLTKKYNLYSTYTLDDCIEYIRNNSNESKI
jgi:hypothetical protein